MSDINVSVASEVMFQVGPVGVTNSVITAFVSSLILIFVAFLIRRKAGIVPTRGQVIFETIYEFLWEKMVMIHGSEDKARKFVPLMMTIFIFFLLVNQFTLIPFVQSIVTEDGVALFRPSTSDYSLPIVLAFVILLIANGLAILQSPLRYIGNYINFKGFMKVKSFKDLPFAFLDLFMGLMDIIGELAKLISLATRLFGNMFAGEVLVAVIVGLGVYTSFLVPIPFIALSVLSGFVQAFVFTILGVIYIGSAIDSTAPEKTA